MAFVGVSANKAFNKAAERRSNWTFKGFFRDENDGRFEAVTKNGFLDWAVPNFDNEFSVKSCCSWEMEDLIVQCKKVSEVKWLPVASDVEIVFFGVCTLWSAMNGTCLMPGMFVALNKWPQSWQSLEQQNLSCKNAFPSPLCTLEPGWNYGPFTRFWLFVQKARLQSGGFQRASWFARPKNHKTAVGGSWWCQPSNKTQSFWFTLCSKVFLLCHLLCPLLTWGCGRSTEEWGKNSVLKLPKTQLLGWNDESFTLATKFVDPIWSFGRLKRNTIMSWPLRLMSPLYATKLVFCAGGSTYLMQKQL